MSLTRSRISSVIFSILDVGVSRTGSPNLTMRRIDMPGRSLARARGLGGPDGLDHRLDRRGNALLVEPPDHLTHPWVALLESLEVRPGQLEHLGPLDAGDRRGSGLSRKKGHLAEEI